jgi:Tol biopolymer transport system component
LKTGVTGQFEKRIATMTMTSSFNGKRERRILSRVATRFAFFGISAILLLSLLAIQGNQSVWAGTFPGPNGQIAFVKGVNGESETNEIFVMNANGSDQTQLINNDVSDEEPSWSPDGEKIAFSGFGDDDSDSRGVFVMNADGSDVTRLTDGSQPSWSPDGEKISFSNDDEIYVMNS